MTVAVLGGGALGLTLAYRLAQAGQQVHVYEREPLPGGLAAGFQVGGVWLEKFYHHLFRTDRAAIDLIEELELGAQLEWFKPHTSVLYGGRLRRLDSAASVLKFDAIPVHDRLRLGAAVAYLKLERNYHRFEHVTAVQWQRRWMGRAASETLWEPLLRAKFGDYAGQILMSWMWARLHYRTSSLGYIRGGFQQLYAKLVERIRELGGTLYFNEAVEGITPSDGALAVWCAGQSNVYEQVVSTLPIAITCRLTPALPAAYRELHGQPLAYGAHCAILELNRRFMRPYWVNVSDPGLPFLAAVEHTNMLPASDYGGKHLMYLGNYLPMQHPLFKQSDQQVVDTFLAALPRLNPAFRPEWVTGSHVFKAPFAQPIVTAEFLERLPGHETPLRGLYVASMFQVYPQDRGQSYSIAMANRVADLVLAAQPDRQPQPA